MVLFEELKELMYLKKKKKNQVLYQASLILSVSATQRQ